MFQLFESTGTKLRAISYGLALGLATSVGIVLTSILLGGSVAWLFDSNGWKGLGEYKPWLPIILGEYSIVPGVVVGAIVGWKTWKSELRGSKLPSATG
jgi:amino acid transporter